MKRAFLILFTILSSVAYGETPAIGLSEAIALAGEQNSSLIRDNLERNSAREQLRFQIRDFLPDLELGFSRSDSVTVGSSDSRVNKLSLGVNQLLFGGGRELRAYRQARRELDLKDFASLALRDSVAYQVTGQYVDVLKNRKTLDILNASRENLKKQLEIASLELELGQIRRVDYLDMQLKESEMRLTIQDTEEQLLTSRFALASLLYLTLEQLPRLSGTLNDAYRGTLLPLAEEDGFVRAMQARAEQQNQALLSLDREEILACQKLQDARLFWLPRIEATGDFSVAGQVYPLDEPAFSLGLNFEFDLPLMPSSVDLQAGKANPDETNRMISTSTDLLDNPEALFDQKNARTALYLKQLEKEESRREVFFQIRSLTENLLMAGERIALERKKLNILKEKLNIQKTELKLGEITRLEYVESEIAYSHEQIAFLTSLVELHSAEEELKNLCAFDPVGNREEKLVNE